MSTVKKKIKQSVTKGMVFINAGYNNTIVTITDPAGNSISASSSGACNFRGSRKATPYAAQVAAQTAVEKSKPYGLAEVDVYVKGPGAGREQAIRSLQTTGLNVLSITDTTPLPHGGCRPKKQRRV